MLIRKRKPAAEAIAAYDAVRQDPKDRRSIRRLRDMRNKALAHSFREEVLIAIPTYNELFRLADAARDVVPGALFAIDGQNADLANIEEIYRDHGEEFWGHALRAPVATP